QFSASGPPVRTHSRESASGRRTAMFRTQRYSLRAYRSKVYCSAMNGAQLIALAHAAIEKAHHLILLAGLLGLSSILAGVISRRIGAPILLVFLGLGMLAGEDGLLGIPYEDFSSAYLLGRVA